MAGGKNTRSQPANRCVMRLGLLEDDHSLAPHDNQELIARLHPQRLASLARNYDLVLGRKRRLSHRFTFLHGVKRSLLARVTRTKADRGSPSCLLSSPLVVRDSSEFQELNRRTVVNDHRYCHTRGGTVGFNQDFLAFECPGKVIHFKSNVR